MNDFYTIRKYFENSVKLFPIFVLTIFLGCSAKEASKPNVIFVFADQWRAQDIGYNGNTIVKTPTIDKLSKESVVFTNAVSGCPVCCPYRASLLTGQYPLTHGVFYNDKPLNPDANSIAKVYKQAGYETGYIGKWHLNGHKPGEKTFDARLKFIPKERRQGFDFWQVLECTHDYNNSFYYGDSPERLKWKEYDALAQTKSAIGYINEKSNPCRRSLGINFKRASNVFSPGLCPFKCHLPMYPVS
jgi:arylsulfatase A-like enzyme